MSVLGASTAVSARLTAYPVLGGQALRYALAAAVFAVIVRRRDLPRIRPSAREWLLLILLSGTGLILFNIFVLAALRHTDAATLGSVVACSPLVLAIAGPMVARAGRRLRSKVTLGAAGLVVAGSAMVQGFGHGTAPGLLFAILVLVCESLFSLLAVPLLPKFGELRVSALVTTIAVPVLLIAGLATDGTAILRVPSLAEAAALLYLALPLTVFAFLLWYRALNGLGPQRAGLLIGAVPVSACAASAALGVGTPGSAQLAGVAVVVVGIVGGLAWGPGAT
ncbi:MAG: DMT family transporter [Catenulispora sp.]